MENALQSESKRAAAVPKVSVIIPCYNAEGFLKECIDSVLGQTLRDIEILCVDDGSADNTPDILREYEKQDARIRVLFQENKGAGFARNHAIDNASGEYIAFMDSDDWYPGVDILDILYNKITQNRVDICGGSLSEYRNGELITIPHGVNEKRTFHQEGIISFSDYQFDYYYQRFLYKRDFLVKNQIYFPGYRRYQDPPFFARAMICAGIFYAVPVITYCYRVEHKKMRWDAGKINGVIRGMVDVLDLAQKHKLSALRKITIERISSFCELAMADGRKTSWWRLFNIFPLIKVKSDAQITTIRLFGFIPLLKIKKKARRVEYRLFFVLPVLLQKIKQ